MNKNEIIDYCLDNSHLPEEELVNGLMSKLNTRNSEGYNHNENSILAACGLQNSTLVVDDHIEIPTIPDEVTSKISTIVEYMEKTYSKRELSFLFVQALKAFSRVSELLNTLRHF